MKIITNLFFCMLYVSFSVVFAEQNDDATIINESSLNNTPNQPITKPPTGEVETTVLTDSAVNTVSKPSDDPSLKNMKKIKSDSDREFAGMKFGVGISLTRDTGKNGRIESAELDENGIVRVSKEKDDIARIMLESHYFFDPSQGGNTSFLWTVDARKWTHGPFVALQPGTDEIIEAIGIGWMVGFRRKNDATDSWNFGIGYVVDPNVKILADGVEENKALSGSETNIRFKETSQAGVLFLVSFGI